VNVAQTPVVTFPSYGPPESCINHPFENWKNPFFPKTCIIHLCARKTRKIHLINAKKWILLILLRVPGAGKEQAGLLGGVSHRV
jgi:hypothetical protein